MKVLEIASLPNEVIAEFGKCIFFVKADRSTIPIIGAYSVESLLVYEDDGTPNKLKWFTHLIPLDSMYE